jgi:hypothetical protein
MLVLLKETGGIWVDESVFVKEHLDRWKHGGKYLWDNAAGMFAFVGATPEHLVSTNVVAARLGSPLVQLWFAAVENSPVWGAPSTNFQKRFRENIERMGHDDWVASTLRVALNAGPPDVRLAWQLLSENSNEGAMCEGGTTHKRVAKCSSLQCQVDVEQCNRAMITVEDKSIVDSEDWLPYFLDRRFSVPDLSRSPGGRLFYIHVPKTGGTAIENMGREIGYSWGRFDRHYDGLPGDGHPKGSNVACGTGGSPWHEPFHYAKRPGPQQTFCVIREPIEKILSEYNFRANSRTCGERFLEEYIDSKLDGLYTRSRHDDDCHLLPQEDYIQSCDFVIPHDKQLAGLNMFLRVRFNISIKQFNQVQPIFAAQGKRCNAKAYNLTARSLDRIRMVYEADFDIFRNARRHFGRLIKEGMVSPQIPDMCGKDRECTEGASDCPHSGCKDPWLDEPVGADWRCIRTGCDPRNPKHLRRKVGWNPATKVNVEGTFENLSNR